jgi:hypothetical protein
MRPTLVTVFLHGSNPKRSYDEYKKRFDCLVALEIPIVLFLDKRSSWSFPPHVMVHKVSLSDTWVGKHIPDTSILPTERSHFDTCEYLKIQNTKTEWLYKASQENPFQTEWFIWVDFGIEHVMKTPKDTLLRLKNIQVPTTPCIRTAGIWPRTSPSIGCVNWRFAGGFLMIHTSRVRELHERVCAKLLEIQPAITWEVNVWNLLENDGIDFGWFLSDHNDTIIPSNV